MQKIIYINHKFYLTLFLVSHRRCLRDEFLFRGKRQNEMLWHQERTWKEEGRSMAYWKARGFIRECRFLASRDLFARAKSLETPAAYCTLGIPTAGVFCICVLSHSHLSIRRRASVADPRWFARFAAAETILCDLSQKYSRDSSFYMAPKTDFESSAKFSNNFTGKEKRSSKDPFRDARSNDKQKQLQEDHSVESAARSFAHRCALKEALSSQVYPWSCILDGRTRANI